MGDTCESCRLKVDDIYWTHFKFIHFAVLLPSDFDQHLALPRKFSDNLKTKLPDRVTLRGPSGTVWSVELISRDGTLHFTNGWHQFAKDHHLEEEGLLVFKYNGESQFDVLLFDPGSLCENVASYFVGNCGHTPSKKNKVKYLEEVNTPPNNGIEKALPDKSVQTEEASPDKSVPSGKASPESKKNCIAAVDSASPEPTKSSRRPERSNARGGGMNWISDSKPASGSKNGMYEILLPSNKRSVTDIERENAIQLAQAACPVDAFYIILRATHITKKFILNIPIKWMNEKLPTHTEDVILRMGEQEWLAKYTFDQSRRAGALAGGWKHFVLENKLQEFDVCVFKPQGKVKKPLIMDVTIFRVNEESSKVKSGGKQGRKNN